MVRLRLLASLLLVSGSTALASTITVTEPPPIDLFAPTSLMLLGLMCAAPHLAGIGSGWAPRRRRR